ncbi:MAG: amino acid adenylation domain-containing protein, partial [Thermoanaerobaculia bacterium]
MARVHGCTQNTILQGLWAVLLARLTGRDDIVFGVTVSGRPAELAGVERMVGLFINTLPLRVVLRPAEKLSRLFARIQEEQTRLMSVQHAGLADIQRAAGIGQLFDTMVVFENYPLDAATTTDTSELQVVGADGRDATHYPLVLVGVPGDRLKLRFDFKSSKFSSEEVSAIASRFLRLLDRVTSDPFVHQLDVLDADERHAAIETFNDTARDVADLTLPELFEVNVARNPDAVAVQSHDESLTYGELDARANRLAHLLIARGAGPGHIVGIALERSAAMVVSMLAVLKTGAAYVPLDPDHPETRLAATIADATPSVVLTTRALCVRLPRTELLLLLDAPETQEVLHRQPAHSPAGIDRFPRQAAYLIYTSGSTGTPKGVIVEHRSVVRMATNTNYVQLDASDVIGQVSNAAFDAIAFEIWGALLHGARLVIVERERLLDPHRLHAAIVDSGITVMFLTTQLFNQVAAEIPDAFRTLRCLLTGGEAADAESFRRVLHAGPPAALANIYGPSETTTFATFFPVGTPPETASIPIGHPIANARVYILDAGLEPVPPGVIGELYIAGSGVTRGYLRRPAMSAERFVADPYAKVPGARMYRTGDLARRNENGTLEFLGRADRQVKIRGFRIEPGEIETALAVQPGVARALVTTRNDGPGGKLLIAYVVPVSGQQLDAATLRAALRERLPESMVPAALMVIDAVPLTPNGKIDWRVLPQPDAPTRDAALTLPSSPMERLVASIWQQVLAIDTVGVDDNFFDLGGHSLMMARVLARLRTQVSPNISIGDLFRHPKAGALAAHLESLAGGSVSAPLVRQTRPERIPLSYAQMRLWLLHRVEGPSATYNIVGTLRLDGDIDTAALEAAFGDVMARHEALRTLFPDVDGVPYQKILSADEARPRLIVEEVTEDALPTRIAEAAATRIDLTSDLPLRTWLFRTAPRSHVLVLVFHHIVSDGWSMGPLLRDLAQAYAARRTGTAPNFAALPIQYADYTLWQRSLLGEENDPDSIIAKQLDFWTAALQGAPAELALPVDHPRPAVPTYRGAGVPLQLDAQLHRKLLDLCATSNATLFMVLQAAFAALLSRLGAGDDLPIGTVVAGRDDAATEELVGFFVRTLALRVDVSGHPTLRELVERVKAFDVEAFGNQDVPFERVVEALEPARSLSRHPLFQVMLVVNNMPQTELTLDELTVRPEPFRADVAKFDLTLTLSEQDAGIAGELEFSLDLFERETAAAIATWFLRLIEAAAMQPDVPLHRLDILDAAERRTLLTDFNDTDRPLPARNIVEMFEAQVAQAPDAMALRMGERSLTYRELDARANQLADLLVERGVQPDTLVGISMERSPEMIIALVGILKAGGGYVPIDADLPPARRKLLIETARLQHIVTEVPSPLRGEGQGEGRISRGTLTAANTAYVNFTSGSTGVPKGVLVPHAAVMRLVHEPNFVRLDRGTRLLHMAPLSFDAATFEIWGALLNGGTLVIMPPGLATVEEIGEVLQTQQVDTLWLTAGLFTQMVNHALPSFAGVRQLIAGGDVLPAEHVQRVRDAHPHCQVINGYGPTENTTFTCCYPVPLDADLRNGVPIGRPIGNTRVYVLDRDLEPVPIGVAGELYIVGAGLARGYLGRAAMTAERFVADPFGPGRMYRTGDLTRWRADGTLEFLGRVDHQVKLRGFRIELGEIEAALLDIVSEACVVARDDGPSGKQLVAYVVPQSVDIALLRRELAARLPDYMVPSAFVTLDALPLNANGKVDRAALPAPGRERDTYRAPRTRKEEILCTLFAELLSLDRVSIDENFFSLGGDSIVAIQLVSRARKAGLDLTPRDVFQHQTIEALAAVSREQTVREVWDADAATGEVIPTPIMHWLFDNAGDRMDAFSQSMLLHVPAGATEEALVATLQKL